MANSVLSVRVEASERDVLEAAARHAKTTLSDFVRRSALEAAEIDLMDRRLIQIPAADWERFETWAHRPPEQSPRLKELLASKPSWEE